MLKNFSKNKKLNEVLNSIYESLEELGKETVKKYVDEFGKYEQFNYYTNFYEKDFPDYNIAQEGNLLVYYEDVRNLYKDYASLKNASNEKIWEIYKRQVGYVARKYVEEA